MTVASKLNIKPTHSVYLVGVPDGVDLELPDEGRIVDDPAMADAVVAFTKSRAELERLQEPMLEAARRDALAWIAYPKAQQLDTDLNRDILWQLLEGRGVRPVRQVSVNDVWSALRFRPEQAPADPSV